MKWALLIILSSLYGCTHTPQRDTELAFSEDIRRDQIYLEEVRREAMNTVLKERIRKMDEEN